MKRKSFSLIAFICIFCLQSCVSEIFFDDGSEMPLVVNCVLHRPEVFWMDNEDSFFGYEISESRLPMQYLDLYRAKRPVETEMQKIDNARVSIKDSKGISHDFAWNGERWECKFLPSYGKKYKLEIISAEKDTLWAEMMFPPRVRLLFMPLEKAQTSFYLGARSLARYFYAQTMLERREQVSYNTTNIHWEPSLYKGAFNLWVSAFERYYDQEYEQVQSLITNHPGVDDFNICKGSWQDTKFAEEEKQDFHTIYNKFQDVARSDIDFWNLFYAECCKSPFHSKYLRIHQTASMPCAFEEGEDCYKRWEGETALDSRLLFLLNADFDPEKPDRYFNLRFVSDEYDSYLRDVSAKFDIHGQEFASHYSMEPVYSNVHGGMGIFGGLYEFNMSYVRLYY
ncbi:MAG: DUF4249 family protein [Bacteroidales bacterium]|nr:DUF4249 family protein [Candidatus Cryptobacteroides equifaecalis]